MNFVNKTGAFAGDVQVQKGDNQVIQATNASKGEIISNIGSAYRIAANVCWIRSNDPEFVCVLDDIVENGNCGRVVSGSFHGHTEKIFQFHMPLSWAGKLMEGHSRPAKGRKKGGLS